MIASLRQRFNASFTPEKYERFQKVMEERCGMPIPFRLCETPCFIPRDLTETMVRYGKELIQQLGSLEYRKASFASIPPEFNVPKESPHPAFIQVDFGLVRDAAGAIQPKLVELQAFPSLYAYQAMLSQVYQEVFELDPKLDYLLGDLDWESYKALFRRVVLAGHSPENVVLMETDPVHQKTRPDFLLTEKLLGIQTVDISQIRKKGNRLFHTRAGNEVPIHRIYNRAIVDELVRKQVKLEFRFTDELEVEWAGNPNWYFRISKYSLPFLKHACVPRTWFLDRVERVPNDLSRYVIKPLFSFAGLGVILQPSKQDLAQIPPEKRSEYILQEKMDFEPVIETPGGMTKAEIRVMYIWADELRPVMMIIRMGRGMMMGVDHNKNLEWVGSSAGLWLRE
jgi:hypothetical protein